MLELLWCSGKPLGQACNTPQLTNATQNNKDIKICTRYFYCTKFNHLMIYFVTGPSGMITGNVSGPCMSGFYYVTQLPKTNLFLLVIEDWMQYKNSSFFNFNCRITQRYAVNPFKFHKISSFTVITILSWLYIEDYYGAFSEHRTVHFFNPKQKQDKGRFITTSQNKH